MNDAVATTSLPTINPHVGVEAKVLKWVVIAGVIRLVLSAISIGSNDAIIWKTIAEEVARNGLIETYRASPVMNHPPLMVLWSVLALKIGSGAWFSFVMRLPAIAADIAAVVLVARWIRERTDDTSRASRGAAAMALSPVAILISGYHCNTDSIYAYLSLLAAYCFASPRRAFFHGGLALAAAINIKLIPLVLLPAAFALCSNRRELIRLAAALALGCIPFVPIALVQPDLIVINMIAYASQVDRWGIQFPLIELAALPKYHAVAIATQDIYRWLGRIIIVLGVILLCARNLWSRRSAHASTRVLGAAELFLACYVIFLVFAPGFGVQYSVMVVPLLVIVSLPGAWTYGVLAGLFLGMVYAASLTSVSLPLLSLFPAGPLLMPGPLFGLLAWWTLVRCLIELLFNAGRVMNPSSPLHSAGNDARG